MFIEGENPAMSDPDLNHPRAGLANLKHLVVQDIFLTETAVLVDVLQHSSKSGIAIRMPIGSAMYPSREEADVGEVVMFDDRFATTDGRALLVPTHDDPLQDDVSLDELSAATLRSYGLSF